MSLLLNSTTAKTAWNLDPRTIHDCDIWFDGADTTTLTLSGSQVTSWRNKGSLNINAVTGTGVVLQGVFINALPFIAVPAGAHLTFTCPLTSQSRSWFIVAECTTQLNASGGASPLYWGPVNQTSGGGQDSVVWTRTSNTGYSPNIGPSGIAVTLASTSLPNPFNTVSVLGMVYNNVTTTNNKITYNGIHYPLSTNIATTGFNTGNVTYTIGTAGYNTGSSICEILHYNRDVSDDERLIIEGYLMWKWGISANKKLYTEFIPTSISGCLLWHDSDVTFNNATSRAQNFTFSSGDTIATWLDKSGNNRTSTAVASPVLTANSISGKCAVQFNGTTQYFTNTLSLTTTQSNTVFAVSKINANKTHVIVSINGNTATTSKLSMTVRATTNDYIYTGGTGTNGNVGLVTAIGRTDINSFHWKGTSPVYTQMNTRGHYIPAATTGTVNSLASGSTSIIGAEGSTKTNFFNGHIAEIIVYNGILPIEYRNQIERYLSLKWGSTLVNACALGHPNKLVPSFLRQFIPTDLGQCAVWLDASDLSTLTLSGSNVTAWRDKSGNNANATLTGTHVYSSSPRYVETPGGSGVITVPCDLRKSTTPKCSVFTVHKWIRNTGGNQCLWGTDFGGGWNRIQLLAFPGYQQIAYGLSLGNNAPNTYAVNGLNTLNTVMYSAIYDMNVVNGTTAHVNGIQNAIFTEGAPTTQTSTQLTYFGEGGSSSFFTPIGFSEIIIFRYKLTAAQRQKIETYLSKKWNLYGNLPATHPAVVGPPIADTSLNYSATLANASLWLDATDLSSLTFSGTTISQWRDKSGNGRTATVSGGAPARSTAAFGGRQSIVFNGTSDNMSGNISITSNVLTIFAVFQLITLQGTVRDQRVVTFASGGTTTDWSSVERTTGINVQAGVHVNQITTYRNSTFIARSGTALVTGTPYIGVVQYTGQNGLVFLNGTEGIIINPSSGNFNILNYGIANQPTPTGERMNGYIGEVVVFAASLTINERVQVEGYLAQKWGVTTNVL